MTDKTKIILACVNTAAAMYDKTLTAPVQKLYVEMLEEFDVELVKRAFRDYIRNGPPFMPKVSDIVSAIEGTSTDQAMMAWGKASSAMRVHGAYRTVVFDDRIIHAVIEQMGGWETFCQIQQKDLPFRAAEFQKLYGALSKNPPAYVANQLTGIHEAHNRREGFTQNIEPPALLGDTMKALEVFETKDPARSAIMAVAIENMKRMRGD